MFKCWRKSNIFPSWFSSCSLNKFSVKGYLSYKTITSENVSYEAHIKNFLFRRKIIFPFSRYSSFCILNIPWFTEPVTPRWALVHEIYTFWTTTHKVTKTGQLIDTMAIIFKNLLNNLERRYRWYIDFV